MCSDALRHRIIASSSFSSPAHVSAYFAPFAEQLRTTWKEAEVDTGQRVAGAYGFRRRGI
eukprot:3606643-Rhodomonas_salina.2